MSNFVAKLIPFLPQSMQFDELAEAASAFNRFSERLSSCKTFHEEKLLIRSEWENARKQLLACRDGDTMLTFDYMSILLYITSVDHWALSDSDKAAFDPVPVIGKLLHSEELRSRKLGALAARLSSSEETALLLANTISKMLDSSQMRVVEMALRVARHSLSPSLVPLFSKGIQRALRSKNALVRKDAWIAYSELVKTDEHTSLDAEVIKNLVMTEADVDVLCSICGFIEYHHQCDAMQEIARHWVEHVQGALMQRPFAVLQCKLLKLMRRMKLGTIEQLKSILKVEFVDGQHAVHLEILKTINTCANDDTSYGAFADLPRRSFEEAPEHGLILLKELSKHSLKTVLLYQEQLLVALDSEDPELRLLALRVLENAANSENWQLLLENCNRIVELCEPVESETIIQAAKIALKLISMFEEPANILESVLKLLDRLPESISEEHLGRLARTIKLGSRPSVAFLTRSYAFEQAHSLMHDLYLINLTSQEAPLDPNFSVRLLAEFLERASRSGKDTFFVREILRSMAWQVSRGTKVDLNTRMIESASDRCIQWLAQLISTADPDLIRGFILRQGDVESAVSDAPLDFDERVRIFEESFAEQANLLAIDIVDNHSTESFTHGTAEEALPRLFPSIGELPTFPESEPETEAAKEPPLAFQITSDLFKGLL